MESLPCNPFICKPIVWGMEREVKRKKIPSLPRPIKKPADFSRLFVELGFGFTPSPVS